MSEWPALPRDDADADERELDLLKVLYASQVADYAARLRDGVADAVRSYEHEWEREKDQWERAQASQAAEEALYKAVHDARIELAKSAIERGRAGAEFVRNAAAGIVTLYTAILGVAFSVTKEAQATPIDAVGIVPAIFLGVALVLATAYVALLGREPVMDPPQPHSNYRTMQERRLSVFTNWASSLALSRVIFLHASVIALGFGVLFLPVAFLDVSSSVVGLVTAVALALTAIIPFFTVRG
jgi:hypothetical protein